MAAVFESPWVAFPLILILQLKVIWGLWAYRDISSGDTAAYFTIAWSWFTDFKVNIAWSPLYTAFYGSFLFVNSDPVWATNAHRVVIIVTCTLLVLAVLRRLLPPAIAWGCTAWWAVLPIVFNTLYEVHLFAVIPVLCVWLLLLTARGPWRRAAALGLLCCSAVLVRNELSVAAGLLALVLGWYEWRRGESPFRPSRVLLAYATVFLLAAGVCGLAYSASHVKYPVLTQTLHHKHAVNMAQVYAFAYQQRHPEWTGSPWFDCYSLMEKQFGNKTPTLREMIRANPAAVREHFAWNLSLAPSGLQLLLFNRASGSVSPDYDGKVIPRLNKRSASYRSWLIVGIWAAGFFALWRGRREWWRDWLSTRGLGWAGMFAVAAVAVPIILTQRPRPSYLFSFGIVLIAITGMCFHAATARWRLTEWLRHVMPILMVVGVFMIPRHFTRAAPEQRPIAHGVERLVPFRDELQSAARLGLVVPACDVGTYICPTALRLDPRDEFTKERLAHSKFKRVFELTDFSRLANRNDHFGEMLARHKVTHVYLEERCLKQLATGDYGEAGDFIAGRDHPSGWGLVGSGNAAGDRWRLYRREE